MHPHPVHRALPLVASVLGDKYGVKVKIGGKQAYTDGSTIHLPSLPINTTFPFPDMVRGYLDHESAHVRHTDFEALAQTGLTPFEKHVWNCLEDWLVERRLCESFPGCRNNLNRLIVQVFGQQASLPQDTGTMVADWILLRIRTWDVPALIVRLEPYSRSLDLLCPGLRDRLERLLDQARMGCCSTTDAIGFAREIAGAITDWLEAQAKANPGNTEENKRTPEESDAKPANGAEGSPREQLEPGKCMERDPSRQAGVSAASHVCQELRSILDAQEQELPKGFGEILADSIERTSSLDGAPRLTVAVIGPKTTTELGADALLKAKRASALLRARLQGMLQTSVLVRGVSARRGRLDHKALHRIAVQDARVFRRRSERQGMDTAVHLLLDCSSSMRKGMELACQSCYALALALESGGVNVAVTAFPGGVDPETRSWATITPLLRHGEKVHTRFGVTASGKTPMGEALWRVMQDMLPLKEARKIIVMLTDGEPDSKPCLQHALAIGGQCGFEVYGIGILNPTIQDILPDQSVVVRAMEELAPAMFRLMQELIPRKR